MNQSYEVIKPVRIKPLENKKRIEWFVNNRPGSTVIMLSGGYIILFGIILGWCLATTPLY